MNGRWSTIAEDGGLILLLVLLVPVAILAVGMPIVLIIRLGLMLGGQ